MKFVGKIARLHKCLEAEGRLIRFTDEQTTQLHQEINDEMRDFRQELALLEAQSIEDTSKIVLNA